MFVELKIESCEELVDRYVDVEWLEVSDAINADVNKLMLQYNWDRYRQTELIIAEQLMQLSFANWMRLSSARTRYFTEVATIIVC